MVKEIIRAKKPFIPLSKSDVERLARMSHTLTGRTTTAGRSEGHTSGGSWNFGHLLGGQRAEGHTSSGSIIKLGHIPAGGGRVDHVPVGGGRIGHGLIGGAQCGHVLNGN